MNFEGKQRDCATRKLNRRLPGRSWLWSDDPNCKASAAQQQGRRLCRHEEKNTARPRNLPERLVVTEDKVLESAAVFDCAAGGCLYSLARSHWGDGFWGELGKERSSRCQQDIKNPQNHLETKTHGNESLRPNRPGRATPRNPIA